MFKIQKENASELTDLLWTVVLRRNWRNLTERKLPHPKEYPSCSEVIERIILTTILTMTFRFTITYKLSNAFWLGSIACITPFTNWKTMASTPPYFETTSLSKIPKRLHLPTWTLLGGEKLSYYYIDLYLYWILMFCIHTVSWSVTQIILIYLLCICY